MNRKFAMAHLTALNWRPPEAIYNCHLIGYDAIGLRIINPGFSGAQDYDLVKDRLLYKSTRNALLETGIVISDIELAKIDDGLDVSAYEPALEAAASLGAKNVTTSVWTKNLDFAKEQFIKLCDIAARFGMNVNLEFVTWSEIKGLCDARPFLAECKKTNAGILLDTLHFYRSRVDMKTLRSCPSDLFNVVHICDAPLEIPEKEEDLVYTGRCERDYPGEGAIPISDILSLMRKDTIYAIELPNEKITQEIGAVEHARRCLVKT